MNVWLDTMLSMYLLAYSAGTGFTSKELCIDVSVSSNLSFFLVDPSLTISYGSFLPTCANHLSGVLSVLSMDFDNSAFSAFLCKETDASSITALSPELACFTGSVLWEIHESKIKIEKQKLPTV